MSSLNRRHFLGATTAAAVGAGIGFPNIVRAQAKETTVLGVWPFTGPYADVGPLLSIGAEIALEEVNYEVGGNKLRYVTRDSETKAGSATRRAEEAITSENAKYMLGPWSSGVALALSEVAKNRKVLHYFSGGTEDISGKRCHRYSFQWAANAWTAMNAVLDGFLKENPQAKKLYLFVVDYAFGWSLQKYVEDAAKKRGMQVVGVDRHPLGQREFSSYITKAAASRPDAIFMINFGIDAVSAARQLNSFGVTPKIPRSGAFSAPFATTRSARRRPATTCAATNGSASSSPALSRAWPGRFTGWSTASCRSTRSAGCARATSSS
jgi:branched-chain amino acid transport system substrate-binding protein